MTQVRMALVDDVPSLVQLVREYWQFEGIPAFDGDRTSVQLKRLLSERDLGAAWIALDEDQPVGYLLAVYVFSLEHFGLTAEIDEFFVLRAYRGSRVGSELLAVAESEFVRAGCTNVSLQLARGNVDARGFYHRYGYRERAGYELLDKTLPAV
ncbi:MAG: GNAT family N-acetyltransferase [Pseudomonadales bacterium]